METAFPLTHCEHRPFNVVNCCNNFTLYILFVCRHLISMSDTDVTLFKINATVLVKIEKKKCINKIKQNVVKQQPQETYTKLKYTRTGKFLMNTFYVLTLTIVTLLY